MAIPSRTSRTVDPAAGVLDGGTRAAHAGSHTASATSVMRPSLACARMSLTYRRSSVAATAAEGESLVGYGAYLRLDTKASKACVCDATVFAGPVSLMK